MVSYEIETMQRGPYIWVVTKGPLPDAIKSGLAIFSKPRKWLRNNDCKGGGCAKTKRGIEEGKYHNFTMENRKGLK